MRRIDLKACRSVPLTADDRFVLETIYRSRIRTFFLVFGALTVLLVLRAGPYLARLGSLSLEGLIGWFVLVFLLLGPALGVFLSAIRPYRRDLRAGFKYCVDEVIIRKEYFPYTDQYFIALDDIRHMHHEVSPELYEQLEVGQSFPVYFAASSHYPFTWRTRVTLM